MPRSKCLRYNDEQLRVLLCIAGYGPLSQTDLSRATGIEKRNLPHVINDLRLHKVLKNYEVPQTCGKRRGRPKEYFSLNSPWLIQDICDELEYRKNQYEIEMKELESQINYEYWDEWSKIANDADKERKQRFLDKYSEIMVERLNLGANDGSISHRAARIEVEGQRTIVWHPYNGIPSSLRVFSYQGIEYWLRRLQSPMLRVLGFLMDNPTTEYSKSEIAEGAGLDMDALSEIWLKLKTSGLIVATQGSQVETYKLNMKNHEVMGLMDTFGLRKILALKNGVPPNP